VDGWLDGSLYLYSAYKFKRVTKCLLCSFKRYFNSAIHTNLVLYMQSGSEDPIVIELKQKVTNLCYVLHRTHIGRSQTLVVIWTYEFKKLEKLQQSSIGQIETPIQDIERQLPSQSISKRILKIGLHFSKLWSKIFSFLLSWVYNAKLCAFCHQVSNILLCKN